MKLYICLCVVIGSCILILGCKENKWIYIKPGYNYIIINSNKGKDDVFHIVDAHYIIDKEVLVPVSKDSIDFYNQMLLSGDELKFWAKNLPKGVSGNIKIDLDSFYSLNIKFLPVIIYLSDKYSNSNFVHDTLWLKKQKICTSFHYVSKKEALKIWKENGNEDITPFTDENILPESFEINIPFNTHLYNIDSIKFLLKSNLKTLSSISYPTALYNSKKILENISLKFNFRN